MEKKVLKIVKKEKTIELSNARKKMIFREDLLVESTFQAAIYDQQDVHMAKYSFLN